MSKEVVVVAAHTSAITTKSKVVMTWAVITSKCHEPICPQNTSHQQQSSSDRPARHLAPGPPWPSLGPNVNDELVIRPLKDDLRYHADAAGFFHKEDMSGRPLRVARLWFCLYIEQLILMTSGMVLGCTI